MRRGLKSLLAAFFLFCAPAFAQGHGPALWKVSGAETSIYIFGSVHALKPGTVWLSEDLHRKISSATAVYMEVSAEEQQPEVLVRLIRRYGLLSQGDSLKKHLPDNIYVKLGAALGQLGVPESAYDRFKPWTADMVYTSSKFDQAGYSPKAGVEATILGVARAGHVPVEGLETAEFQIALLSSLTEPEVIEMLKDDLVDKDQIATVMGRLTASWSSGDVNDLATFFAEDTGADPELRRKMFTDRNASWVVKIRAIMDKPGNYVVVVGAGHLVGPESLIALLQKAGVPVERVN
jgi:uncharacterized protein YbaP (TraB family)